MEIAGLPYEPERSSREPPMNPQASIDTRLVVSDAEPPWAPEVRLIEATMAMADELERECGLSSLYLDSGGDQFGDARLEQVLTTCEAEARWRRALQDFGGREADERGVRQTMEDAVRQLDRLPSQRRRILTLEDQVPQIVEAYRAVDGALRQVLHDLTAASLPLDMLPDLLDIEALLRNRAGLAWSRSMGNARWSAEQEPELDRLAQDLVDAGDSQAPALRRETWFVGCSRVINQLNERLLDAFDRLRLRLPGSDTVQGSALH